MFMLSEVKKPHPGKFLNTRQSRVKNATESHVGLGLFIPRNSPLHTFYSSDFVIYSTPGKKVALRLKEGFGVSLGILFLLLYKVV